EVTPEMLSGIVEIDETYVGGKRRHVGRRGDRLANKSMVIGALERGGSVRLRVERRSNRLDTDLAADFIEDTVADEASAIYTDEHRAYDRVGDADTRHETVNHGEE